MRRCLIAMLIALVGAMAPGCQKLLSSDDVDADPNFVPTTTGKAIVDTDYRFQLKPPGGTWRLMREGEIRQVIPDAVAGAVSVPAAFGGVIVEKAPGVAAQEMAQLVVDNMGLENKQADPFEQVQFAGKQATRAVVTGTINGIEFRFVIYMFSHQDHAYQIVAGGVASRVDERGEVLRPFFDAFSLLDGRVQGRTAERKAVDSSGAGWRVKDGVFESAVYGLRIEPRIPWRLAVGVELEQMNSNAEVGLTSEHAYLVVLAERAAGADPKSFARKLAKDTSRQLDGEPFGKPEKVPFAGGELTLTRIRTTTPPRLEYRHGVLFHGDVAVRILYWSLTALADKAAELLPAALASIRFMTPKATQTLAAELAAGPDTQNQVGPGYSLRRGVWRDFDNALVWKKPPGFWRISTGQRARAFNPDASLIIEDPVSGLFGQLIVEPAADIILPDYHRLVVDGALANGKQVRTRKMQLGSIPAMSTTGRTREGGLELAYRLTTCVHAGKAVQLTFWGVPAAMRQYAESVDQAVAALRLPATLKMTEELGQKYLDHRLGFSYQPPGTGWTHSEMTPADILKLGTLIRFKRGRKEILLLAVCVIQAGHDRNWFLRFIEESLRRQRAGRALGTPDRSQVEFAGERWDRLRWKGLVRAEAHLVMRDKTLYALIGMSGGSFSKPPDKVTQGFAFLD